MFPVGFVMGAISQRLHGKIVDSIYVGRKVL